MPDIEVGVRNVSIIFERYLFGVYFYMCDTNFFVLPIDVVAESRLSNRRQPSRLSNAESDTSELSHPDITINLARLFTSSELSFLATMATDIN